MEIRKPPGRLSCHSRILSVTASQLLAQGSRVIYTQGESETKNDSLKCTHERLMGKPHIDGVISCDKWLTRIPVYSSSSVQTPNPSNGKSCIRNQVILSKLVGESELEQGSRSWVDSDSTGSAWIFVLTLESELGEDSSHRQRWKCIKNCLFLFCSILKFSFGLQTDYPSSINNLLLSYHKIRYCLPFMYHYGSTSFSDPVFLSWDLEILFLKTVSADSCSGGKLLLL